MPALLQKKCPTCSTPLKPEETLCKCGYDFTMDDCPGCEARIPEGSTICPHCSYDILEGVPAKTKPVKKEKPKPAPVEKPAAKVVEKEEGVPNVRVVPGGMRKTHCIALGHYGIPDSNYSELFWPKGQEVNDENLFEWAESFRESYREKCPGRKECYLSNCAIAGWCKSDAVFHAKRYDKAGQNDVLRDNANRILELLGGNDRKAGE